MVSVLGHNLPTSLSIQGRTSAAAGIWKAPNETPHFLEGSGLTTAPVDGMGREKE